MVDSNVAGLEGGAVYFGIKHFAILVRNTTFLSNRAVYGGG